MPSATAPCTPARRTGDLSFLGAPCVSTVDMALFPACVDAVYRQRYRATVDGVNIKVDGVNKACSARERVGRGVMTS
jgi:hypothetical protein